MLSFTLTASSSTSFDSSCCKPELKQNYLFSFSLSIEWMTTFSCKYVNSSINISFFKKV